MKKIPYGKVITVGKIREFFANSLGVCITRSDRTRSPAFPAETIKRRYLKIVKVAIEKQRRYFSPAVLRMLRMSEGLYRIIRRIVWINSLI